MSLLIRGKTFSQKIHFKKTKELGVFFKIFALKGPNSKLSSTLQLNILFSFYYNRLVNKSSTCWNVIKMQVFNFKFSTAKQVVSCKHKDQDASVILDTLVKIFRY